METCCGPEKGLFVNGACVVPPRAATLTLPLAHHPPHVPALSTHCCEEHEDDREDDLILCLLLGLLGQEHGLDVGQDTALRNGHA